MASETEICNMALCELGVTRFISGIHPSDGSEEGDVLSMLYTPSLEHVLRDMMPRFATKRKSLALVDEELVTNWEYCYSYPNDCLRIQQIVTTAARMPRSDESVAFEVANYNDKRVILTDQENAEVIYTSKITDPNLWDPMFVTAFINFLASRAAMPLGHGELANNLLQAYYALSSQAQSVALNESNAGELPMGGFESARQ
jgi:hypothetical protein